MRNLFPSERKLAVFIASTLGLNADLVIRRITEFYENMPTNFLDADEETVTAAWWRFSDFCSHVELFWRTYDGPRNITRFGSSCTMCFKVKPIVKQLCTFFAHGDRFVHSARVLGPGAYEMESFSFCCDCVTGSDDVMSAHEEGMLSNRTGYVMLSLWYDDVLLDLMEMIISDIQTERQSAMSSVVSSIGMDRAARNPNPVGEDLPNPSTLSIPSAVAQHGLSAEDADLAADMNNALTNGARRQQDDDVL